MQADMPRNNSVQIRIFSNGRGLDADKGNSLFRDSKSIFMPFLTSSQSSAHDQSMISKY